MNEVIEGRIANTKSLRGRIADLREELVDLLTGVSHVPEAPRHAAIARTALEDAEMRLGKVLGAIGKANPGLVRDPYPTSRDPGSPGIDPTARECVAVPRGQTGLL